VTIPPLREPGVHRSEVVARWPDGKTHAAPIAWEVVARLTAHPSSFLVEAGSDPVEKTVLLSSTDRPFRILGVRGASPGPGAGLPMPEARTNQAVRLLLSPSASPGTATDVTLTTDDPDQPSVSVTVLTVSRPKE